jgi:hypothetical protein
LIVFGAKLLVLEKNGSDLPFYDQWDAEASGVFVPYIEGNFHLGQLFAPQNEHRIFFTRTLNFGLMLANGQWDALMQCVVNAMLHAAILACLLEWIRRQLGIVATISSFVILTVMAGLPIVWENTICGFQSQFYFLLGFSLLAMNWFLSAAVWSWRWWLAIISSLCSIFSMGSGFFCVVPVMMVFICKIWFNRPTWRKQMPTLVACCAIAAIGWSLRSRPPENIMFQAHTVKDFVFSFMRCAAWPNNNNFWLAPLLYLPLAILFWREQKELLVKPACQFVLAFGFWILLQCAAMAFARGNGGAGPANRYCDLLSMGVLVNSLALIMLVKDSVFLRPRFSWLNALILLWCIVLIQGTHHRLHVEMRDDLPQRKAWLQANEINVRGFLITGKFADTNRTSLPYPSADSLAQRLDNPWIRRILPASVRMPIALDPTNSNSNFSTDAVAPDIAPLSYRKVWGSFGHAAPGHGVDWQSKVLMPSHGFWKFEVVGDLISPGCSLQLISENTHQILADIRPDRSDRKNWQSVYVRAPAEVCILVAHDERVGGWFAFSEPVEVATGSWLTRQLIHQWIILLTAGFFITFTSIGMIFWKSRENTR